MKELDIKVMRGANYWSNYRKQLIVLKLDIEELEILPTNKIEGFAERLEQLIPSLYGHTCSEKHEGGLFERVKEGTWMGHVVEHIALEIQSLAGMDCGFGRTRSTQIKGVYNVVFSFEIEEAGLYAGRAAIDIAAALIKNAPYDIEKDITTLKNIKSKNGLGPSTQAIVDEARLLNIPYKRMDNSSLVILGQGSNQKKIRAAMTSLTSGIGIEMAGDKEDTKKLLSQFYIPVPKGIVVYDEEELLKCIENKDIVFPIVIKPIDGNHGRGITINVKTVDEALVAFKIATKISSGVILEEFIEGFDYRFLVINYKMVAVAKRTPAMVMGDGKSTIQQLINQVNADPKRGDGHEKVLTTIKVDEITRNILAKKDLTLATVLPLGEILFLKDTANISSGGTSRDVTDIVHPHNKLLVERIASILNLDICGIDVVASDINVPITRVVGGVVEVNACPGLRMHLNPSKGMARNVAQPILEMLFPNPMDARIPIIAVTGTNGKTTTTRLIAHLAQTENYKVGFTTTDGIYIQGKEIHSGDCTGPKSAEVVLLDPTINFAVLETARGGILRSGLGYDECDISIVTNITEDHLGLKGIDTIVEMAKVKAVVAKSTKKEGHCILNADDELVYNMREDLDCNIALFSMQSDNPYLLAHASKGGYTAFIEKEYVVVSKGSWKNRIGKVANIPLSMNGRAVCMIKNILPAVLAAFIQKFDIEKIKEGLNTFYPSPEQTPGRMNIFNFPHFDLMIDYAHNTDGFLELKKFLDKTEAPIKVGIISVAGDRRDDDIRNIGKTSAQMFDQIIIRHDKDLRGRNAESITTLLTEGIHHENSSIVINVIPDEEEAIQYAIDNAKKNTFITLSTDDVKGSIEYVKKALILIETNLTKHTNRANNKFDAQQLTPLKVNDISFGMISKQ
ncbi:MAG: cyanophycin synthetase [Bacteroidia bacterium]